METNETETVVEEVEEDVVEETPPETEDPAELKARIKTLEEKAIAQRERTKILKQEMAKFKTQSEKLSEKKPEKVETKSGELDEAQMDFFELKGFSDPDEVEVFANIMKKTGMSHREVLKDEYAVGKVAKIREQKAVQNAMPGSTKRSSGGTLGLDAAIAKFESTGELPSDFALRSAVINAKVEKESVTTPPWHRK